MLGSKSEDAFLAFCSSCLKDLHVFSSDLLEDDNDLSDPLIQHLGALDSLSGALRGLMLPDSPDFRAELTLSEFNFGECFEKTVQAFSRIAGANHHELYCYVSPSLPASVFGDRSKLRVVTQMLLLFAGYVRSDGDLQASADRRDGGDIEMRVAVSGKVRDSATDSRVSSIASACCESMGGTLNHSATKDSHCWNLRLPLEAVEGLDHPESPGALQGMRIAHVGESPLCCALNAYLPDQGAILEDRYADADALIVAVPPEDAQWYLEQSRHEHPRLPLLCQGATGRSLSSVIMGCDEVLPMPLTRDALVRGVLAATERYENRAAIRYGAVRDEPPEIVVERISAKVLLAEDDAIGAQVVTHFLKAFGCNVIHTRDGEESLGALTGEAFDLVLLDMHMPLLDGTTVARQYREWEAGQGRARTPLVALTASAGVQDERLCRAAGMDGFLTKPVSKQMLLEALQRYLPDDRVDTAENR